MSPSPGGRDSPSQEYKGGGGFASVFKGLANATKLAKSSPTSAQSSGPSAIHAEISEQLKSIPVTSALPPQFTALFRQLHDGTANERVAAANALRDVVSDYPLNPVPDIWHAARDLVASTNPKATRVAGWELLSECARHPTLTDLERKDYFETISMLTHPDDFHWQLGALDSLSKHGRDVSGFDYDIFPLLAKWLQASFDLVRGARSAAKKQNHRSKDKMGPTQEENDFERLLALVSDVIKFNSVVADDGTAEDLVDTLLRVCLYTNIADDMRACIGILDAIITFGVLPGSKLKKCVQVLSSIHCMVQEVQKEAWHTISILCRSHNGQATVRVLLRILSSATEDRLKKKEDVRNIRGALSVLAKLVSKSSEKGYPKVPYALLTSGLSRVVATTSTWKIYLDMIRLAIALFHHARGGINSLLVDEDWTSIFDIVSACSAGAIRLLSKSGQSIRAQSLDEDRHPEKLIVGDLVKLVPLIENIIRNQQGAFIQRQDCILFFVKVHPAISDSAALLVLNYYKEFRCCFPSDAQWKANLSLVLDAFLKDKERGTAVRLQALQVVTEVYDMLDLIQDQTEPDLLFVFMRRLLAGVADETDVTVLEAIVSFAVTVATATKVPLFCQIINTLGGIVGTSHSRTSSGPSLSPGPDATPSLASRPPLGQTPANVVTRGFVQIFLRVMNDNAEKAIRIFYTLVSIARSKNEIDARITAMKLLFRIRADWADRIFVTTDTDTNSLATTLIRTESALARRPSEDGPQQGRMARADAGTPLTRPSRGISFSQGQPSERIPPSRVSSGSHTGGPTYQPLWIASDIDALPEPPSTAASSVLCSGVSSVESARGFDAPMMIPDASVLASDVLMAHILSDGKGRTLLPMGVWLEAILHLFQTGCDWEVCSYILVYLPSQLSNHGIFGLAVPQLQELRGVICSKIQNNSFPDPPVASGSRKADVVVGFLHMLTILLSYHRHFQKPEEDEIVKVFLYALCTWERSARTSIHALEICCHELPSSVGKSLMPILQRMAQIITQPYAAMPILEFLAGLSRLPSIYVNFRKEDYQTVFGICVRYLQSVRGKKPANRPGSTGDLTVFGRAAAESHARPNASDDLPQYVYTLAYHVIIFWFLAMKLADRASHVSWIAKNLFTDVDGSQVAEEQAQTSIDFMQRVAFADVDESAADPSFTSDRLGEIVKKRWLIGNSIFTIEQAVASGWAQITKRQASGTSSYTIRELFRPPPEHQEPIPNKAGNQGASAITNAVQPSHLLVQLLSPIPQYSDMNRPVPLPDNDAVDRTIKLFDRNSTVDGHKVGVIYIGENQVDEVEILANVSGSSEYVTFLDGLGTLIKLKGATFNTQGLDRQYDSDGEYTYCWRDRVTELVFHVTTLMPTNLDHDPRCGLKKSHIGNDFVNIIFNDSGLPFKFDTFRSEFNYVNIVITPESRASFVATRMRTPKDVDNSFYKVQVMSKPGFPEILSAAESKIISLKALPDYVRLLALNASFFSHVWVKRDGGEHISSWGNRLREINRLREKYAPKSPHSHGGSQGGSHGLTVSPPPPGTASSHASIAATTDAPRPSSMVRDGLGGISLRRSSVATFFTTGTAPDHSSHRPSVHSVATDNTEGPSPTTVDALMESLDFSRWA
ncbi:hypothetical protein GGS20DRAFT_383529 [Poronia punctata]|nr:hypothetical protein GGS20DRAFT_383529 [Poronia punctata]